MTLRSHLVIPDPSNFLDGRLAGVWREVFNRDTHGSGRATRVMSRGGPRSSRDQEPSFGISRSRVSQKRSICSSPVEPS